MSALTNALAAARQTLERLAGVTIRYGDGVHTVELAAVPGKTPVELLEGDDVVEQVRYTDWLLLPSALVLNGAQIEPRRNHTIEVIDQASPLVGATFVVSELPTDRQVWRYSEEHGRSWLRVHSLLVDDGAEI